MLAVILLLIVLIVLVVVVVVVTVSRRGYLLIRPDQARSDCDQSGVGASTHRSATSGLKRGGIATKQTDRRSNQVERVV